MGLDDVIAGLLGVAFGIRALDDNKHPVARVGYGVVGADLIYHALTSSSSPVIPGVGGQKKRLGDAGEMGYSKVTGAKTVPLNFEHKVARNIAQRVGYIVDQMQKGTKDPRVYSLARSVLSRKCNGEWCVPEKDAWAEGCALFYETRQRIRYTWDPTDYDAFQTPGKTLMLGTGDCDDQVALLGAMLRTIGHNVACRVVHTKGFDTWNHIYLRMRLPSGDWKTLDPTVNKAPGWEVPKEYMLKEPRDFIVNEKGKPDTSVLRR